MSTAHKTVKLDSSFVEKARQEADLFHRSVGGQIEYWARLGRAVEGSAFFSHDRIRAALAGEMTVEHLTAPERAAFFDRLGDALAAPTPRERNFYAALGARPGATGRDEAGQLVRRTETGKVEPIETP